MAAISLREYVREIEKQVDGGRNEEAIAHSRYVLESFPKYVDVYRLLGKAYLESQRYGDAGDIFQRVLSAVPEDFVSHVGMSIIREDEGNLDEAIWHMERAFDVQPSNSAIQEELRRLHGRRDNLEPPKIRLTRGALARMYYRGDLYPQAIAEVRAALNETPDRLDLQVLLAEIYAKAGQRAEAVEMAGQVLRRLPYCLAANQVMVDMLIGTEREGEIQTFYQRLSQLDPYAAHVTTTAPRAENVPDQAIRLNKLDYRASQTIESGPGQPLWAATLGIEAAEMATGREESLPEWLATGSTAEGGEREAVEGASVPAFASDTMQEAEEELIELPGEPTEEEQIPEWMKDLGWGPASEDSREAEAELQFDEEAETQAEEGELAAAEIPDWLKAMAPEGATGEAKEEEDVSPWLDQLFPSEKPTGEADEKLELPGIAAEAEAPEWLEAGLALGAAAAGAAMLGKEEEEPEGAEVPQAEGASLEEMLGETIEEALPAEAVSETSAEEVEAISEDAIEMPSVAGAVAMPDWLAELAPEEEPTDELSGEELPDWLRETLAPAAEMAPVEEEAADWIMEESSTREALATEKGEGSAAELAEEELPSWLFESETATSGKAAVEAEAELETAEEELSGWLFESEAATGEEATVEAEAELEAEEEELPGWLFEGETAGGEEAPAEIEAEMAEEMPGWLFEGEAAAGIHAGAAEESLGERSEVGEELPDWLKAAGVATGAAAAFKASEWLSEEETTESEATPAAVEIEGALESEEALPAEELPEWLRPVGETGETVEEEIDLAELEISELELIEAAVSEELPEEAEVTELEDIQPTQLEAEVAAAEESPELEEAFAWLNNLLTPVEESEMVEETQEPEGEEMKATIEPEVPASESPASGPAAAQPGEEVPFDEDAAFAWLESLAVRQGAQEALLLKPEERREAPPDWLAAAAAAGAAEVISKATTDEEGKEEVIVEQAVEAPTAEAISKAVEALETVNEAPVEQALDAEIRAEAELAEPEAKVSAIAEEEPPELPDWLAGTVEETRDETLEWTPPPLSRRKYDLNKITLVEMERLPGVGFILAQRVIDYRNTRGPFKKIEDLLEVSDFNLAALDGIRENLYLEIPSETTPPPAGRVPTQPRPGTGPLVLATGAGLPNEVVKAREHLSEGYVDEALELYDGLIHSKQHLTWVIEDLSEASNQYPNELYVWQSLGDAYVRSDLASQALQSYIRAEKLLVL